MVSNMHTVKSVNGLICVEVPLRSYSLTHSIAVMSSTIDEDTKLVSSVLFCIMIITFTADPCHTWDCLPPLSHSLLLVMFYISRLSMIIVSMPRPLGRGLKR